MPAKIKFKDWFKREYHRWVKSQPGEEDFLAFCDLLGYPPYKILDWLKGEAAPEGPEILSIAGALSPDVYAALGMEQPDPEILKLFSSFSHLKGEFRSRLAGAFYEVESEVQKREISYQSNEVKPLFEEIFEKWGLNCQ